MRPATPNSLRRAWRTMDHDHEDDAYARVPTISLADSLQDGWNVCHPSSRGSSQRTIPINNVDSSARQLFLTNFGPNTLTQFLREEIEKLRQSVNSYSGKGKGKAVETYHSSEAAQPGDSEELRNHHATAETKNNGHLETTTTLLPGSIHGTFADKQFIHHQARSTCVPEQHGSSSVASSSSLPCQDLRPLECTGQSSLLLNAALRRSERLTRKMQSNYIAGMKNASSDYDGPSNADRGENTKSFHDSHIATLPSVQDASVSVDRDHVRNPSRPATSCETMTDSDRRSHFEEHTKSRRHLVRRVPNGPPVQPHDVTDLVRTRVRQRQTLGESTYQSSLHDASRDSLTSNTDHVACSGQSLSPRCGGRGKNGRRLNSDRPQQNNLPKHMRLDTTQLSKDRAPLTITDVSKFVDRFFRSMGSTDEATRAPGNVRHAAMVKSIPPQTVPSHFNYTDIVSDKLPGDVKRDILHSVQRITGSLKLQQLLVAYDLEMFLGGHDGPSPLNPADILTPIFQSDSVCVSYGGEGDLSLEPGVPQHSLSLNDFNEDHWMGIAQHLSPQDIRSLRLVSRTLAQRLGPVLFRNVVVNFGKGFFDIDNPEWDSKCGQPPSNSMLKKYGDNINQFGLAFEYDLEGLANASDKVIEKEQDAWFGRFTWPTENYPRFSAIQSQEDLVDHNRPLLREAFQHVTKASELGLCIDSGHGWLEGPDMSDLALFDRRTKKGSPIFGKTFKTEDVWTTLGRHLYFHWAQQNTIQETIKLLKKPAGDDFGNACHRASTSTVDEIDFWNHVESSNIESFREPPNPLDEVEDPHIGEFSNFRRVRPQFDLDSASGMLDAHQSQWPLIFGGYNLAAQLGSVNEGLYSKLAHPTCSPLLPGALTEAQAQWLMETAWAQRTFLSSYTTAIISNKLNFTNVHTLRISKLSSGLLPSIAQKEFWASLPGLKKLQILVSPDWRQEYVIGDRSFGLDMLISPAKAAEKFTHFLREHVAKLETLLSLTIGYVGGGEHAVGMFARNQHVLFAPIVDNPIQWLHHLDQPALITRFDHVRELKFENCWFTPWMLREFMETSKDTSLHTLNLDSVSMTAIHDPTLESRLLAQGSGSRCIWPRFSWLKEKLPTSAAWCRVLDDITPGLTFLERKYNAGMIDDDEHPRAQRPFRGHVRKIILKSCGYVKISTQHDNPLVYSQNALLAHSHVPMDQGLFKRMQQYVKVPTLMSFEESEVRLNQSSSRPKRFEDHARRHIMQSVSNPIESRWPWLGTLTQCVHPIEKRVLEEAWGMTFGWGNDLARFGPVEDGFFEGGTGRFSGVIESHTSTGPDPSD
ncbi:uncharacterized protein PV06_07961 [Exophiala oligosperma]|uniref:F-box domain-containing protein n=1 Tax=Exophiala oligosperma TaxID=215243 RepID=A0A0D2DCG4_9EURO|nr:uncharacterized protein PV06_07961 [Exophiala oligosperma]KIW40788.1 hypothetical protein PV06_07961 [Exophiala oligosperma]